MSSNKNSGENWFGGWFGNTSTSQFASLILLILGLFSHKRSVPSPNTIDSPHQYCKEERGTKGWSWGWGSFIKEPPIILPFILIGWDWVKWLPLAARKAGRVSGIRDGKSSDWLTAGLHPLGLGMWLPRTKSGLFQQGGWGNSSQDSDSQERINGPSLGHRVWVTIYDWKVIFWKEAGSCGWKKGDGSWV